MLWLNPTHVHLAGQLIGDVTAIALSAKAQKTVIEHSDFGPHPVFADVPEQRAELEIIHRPGAPAQVPPSLGELVPLSFIVAPTGADSARIQFQAQVVITEVEHEFHAKSGALRTIRAIAISSDGAIDPLSQTSII